MKKIFTLILIALTINVFAQAPQKISYQAVIRNTGSALVTSTTVGMQISILQGSSTGTLVYVETQTPTSNANGLVSLEIGTGTIVTGTFANIDWTAGPYFIKTETDPLGGTNYSIFGTSELLSVPYALHAKTAESITGSISENDPVFVGSPANGINSSDITNWNNKLDAEVDGSVTNEIQALSISNDTVYLSNGGFVKLPVGFNGDYNNLVNTPTNVSTFTNDAGYLTTYTEIDPKIGSNTSGFSPKWNGFALVTGAVYQDSTNKIGIGTTVPSNALSVIGSGDFSTSVKSPLYTALAGNGNSVTIQANNSNTGVGGNVNIYSGIGSPGNYGGQINIVGTPIGAGVGQAISIIGSDNSGGGGNNAGPIVIRGGNASVANGGIISITGGSSGGGNSASAGEVTITGGAHVGSSPQLCGGANVTISGGAQTVASAAGVGGSVIIKGGVSSGSGAHGSILMQTGATSSTKLLIDPLGNVGIGTTTPTSKLEVNGQIKITGGTASQFLKADGSMDANTYLTSVTEVDGSVTNEIQALSISNDTINLSNGGFVKLPSANAWSLNGNGGTIDGTNFIGTIDNVALSFKVNNQKAGRIDAVGSTYFGYQSGNSNTTGANNTANGYQSLFFNTTGGENVAIGNYSLYQNTIGSSNIGIGYAALNKNTTGNANTAIGYDALFYNTTGNENTATGRVALHYNTTGVWNTANGSVALMNNTTGNNNTSIGYGSLFANTIGSNNTAIGMKSLNNSVGGMHNSALGVSALESNTNGGYNTAIGSYSFRYNTAGNYNTIIGSQAGENNANGSSNVFIGYAAGYNETGSNKLYIANHPTNPPLVYGDFSTGRVGIGTITPGAALEVNGQIKITGGTSSQFLKADGSIDATLYLTAIVEIADEFNALVSQTNFTLTQTPSTNSKVKMYINGIRISNTAYNVSGTTLTYVPANNGSYIITAGDRIQFDYYY